MEKQFIELCWQGNLIEAQELLRSNPTFDILEYNERIFHWACKDGHLHVAQWIFQVSKEKKQSIHIWTIEDIFCWACENGRLHVAQWLLQIKPELNISVYNETPFRDACKKGHLELAQWLQSLKPYLYVIEYDENGKMKSYRVRRKEEDNWQKRKYLVWLASNNCPKENKHNLLYKLPSDVSRIVIGFL